MGCTEDSVWTPGRKTKHPANPQWRVEPRWHATKYGDIIIYPVFWIRIQIFCWIRIRIRIQVVALSGYNPCPDSDPDHNFLGQRIIIFWTKKNYLGIKTDICVFLNPLQKTFRLHDIPPARQKTFQLWNFFIFSCFWDNFGLPGSGSGSADPFEYGSPRIHGSGSGFISDPAHLISTVALKRPTKSEFF